MGLDTELEQEVAARRSLALQTDDLPVVHTGRDLYGKLGIVYLQRYRTTQGRRDEGDGDFRLDLLGTCSPAPSSAARTLAEGALHVDRPGTTTKKLPKQIGRLP